MAKRTKEEEDKPRMVIARYKTRLTVLRQAQEYSRTDNIHHAVQSYLTYLSALAGYYGVEDESKLKPSLFDQEKDLTELLLLSQVYWDLSKAYDRNPKLTSETERCLRQFVSFTIGYKYQYLNYDLLRKFIKKDVAYNPNLFKAALNELRIHSKRCYIASFAFHSESHVVETLRHFKTDFLLSSKLGEKFVDLYYSYSPRLILFLENTPRVARIFKLLTRPLLFLIAKLYKSLK